MSYYEKQGFRVIAGGLLYPIEKDDTKLKDHADNWLGDTNTKFIVDGVDLFGIDDTSTMFDIQGRENDFIERIYALSKEDRNISEKV